MKAEGDPLKNVDLSFLSAEEEFAILRVLKRDARLRRLEDRRVRQLRSSIFDPRQLKIMTGEWFDEMKSRRYGKHYDVVHMVRSLFKRKKNPASEGDANEPEERESRRDQPFKTQQESWSLLWKKKTPASQSTVVKSGESSLPEEMTDEKYLKKMAKDLADENATVDQTGKENVQCKSNTESTVSNDQNQQIPEVPSTTSALNSCGTAQIDNQTLKLSMSMEDKVGDASQYKCQLSPPLVSKCGSPEENKQAETLEISKESESTLEPSTLLFLSPAFQEENALGKSAGKKLVQEEFWVKTVTEIGEVEESFTVNERKPQATSQAGPRQSCQLEDTHRCQDSYSFPEPSKGLCYGTEIQKPVSPSPSSALGTGTKSARLVPWVVMDSAEGIQKTRLDSAVLKHGEGFYANECQYKDHIADSDQEGRSSLLVTGDAKTKATIDMSLETTGGTPGEQSVQGNESSTKLQDHSLQGMHSLDVLEFALPSAHSTPEKEMPLEMKGISRFNPSNSFSESDSIQRMRSAEEEFKSLQEDSPRYSGIDFSDVKQVLFSSKLDDSDIPPEASEKLINEETKQIGTYNVLVPESIPDASQYSLADSSLMPHVSMPEEEQTVKVPTILVTEAAGTKEISAASVVDGWVTSTLKEAENQPAVLNVSSEGFSAVPLSSSSSALEIWEDNNQDQNNDLGSVSSIGSDASLMTTGQSSSLLSVSGLSASLLSLYSDAGDFGNLTVQGAVEFSITYSSRGELVILIEQCQDLAIGNTKKNRTDPYVKTYLNPDKSRLSKRKTSVKKNTVNPVFQESLKYKLEKVELQSRVLNVSVWHNDSLGRNAFLGEVEIDLKTWDWNHEAPAWYNLQPKSPEDQEPKGSRGQLIVALKYVPAGSIDGTKPFTGELHIWLKEARNLQKVKPSGVDSFVKCYILPDTSKKNRQKTRVVKKTLHPVYNHTMVYDGFRHEEIKEACCELTLWDHDTFTNQFLGGVHLSLGTGKSYGKTVDWMDSIDKEVELWKNMLLSPGEWVEEELSLRQSMARRK
ncbi:synaptotagmin-like protein 2 [Lepisosteus oculatus]|uniref:synaptotagmin-like protein 2 n=1 Tax=Lepisosteus oculatus TaxID=7918 RepID=UPI0035F52D25